MGLCLSHCGQAQHKAAVVAVSISHQSSASPARPSRSDHAQADPSQSLKRFLHLYNDGGEGRKRSTLSPRASLDDSLAIPHSSELFSLPSEGGLDSDRSRSPSPARGSVASIARSSTSSRAAVSPNGRRSIGVRPGRFSTEKPPIAPRASNAKKAPARKSCSSLGQAPEPHKNLVETIARLEKFCDVKLFLEKRSSVVRNSSHEVTTACAHENSILLHDSCRDLAQKLLCFANEHAYYNSHGDGGLSRSMRLCDSAKEMKPGAAEVKQSVPLEKSVASFLKEVENFVSKVDAAAPQQPVEQVTKGERCEGVSRLHSLRFQNADEKIQFTDFEATFESLDPEPLESSSPDRSLEADQTSDHSCDATQGSQQEKKPKNSMPRLALTDISTNVTPAHDPLAGKNHSLKVRTPTGLKRGVTRSLDSQDGSIPQLEFNALKRERLELTQESLNSTQAATLSKEEPLKSKAADHPATIERLGNVAEDNAASPSSDAAPSQLQQTKQSVSVDGEEPIQESRCAEDENAAGETSDVQDTDTRLLNKDPEKSLSMAFDNLLKLLQSPPGELAQNTSELLELLAAKTDTGTNSESSADSTLFSEVDTALETQADILQPCELESWHDAPASLSITEQSELHSPTQ